MPGFDSPISNKRFAATPLKDVEVPDESSNMPEVDERAIHEFQERMQREQRRDPREIEREIRAAKEARRTGRERLPEGAVRRLEMLLGMTNTTRVADIGGNEFVFKSLQAKEMRAAIMAASAFDNTVQSPFEIRKQFLARSLIKIAGVDFEQFIGSTDLESKLIFVEELDEALVNRLYDEYLALAKEARDKFAIKNSEDAKSVVEDLKK
jgi:hypothetical protein